MKMEKTLKNLYQEKAVRKKRLLSATTAVQSNREQLLLEKHLCWSLSLMKLQIVCVCKRVCLCVCVYTLSPAGFFWPHDICDILDMFGSTIFCCEY